MHVFSSQPNVLEFLAFANRVETSCSAKQRKYTGQNDSTKTSWAHLKRSFFNVPKWRSYQRIYQYAKLHRGWRWKLHFRAPVGWKLGTARYLVQIFDMMGSDIKFLTKKLKQFPKYRALVEMSLELLLRWLEVTEYCTVVWPWCLSPKNCAAVDGEISLAAGDPPLRLRPCD